jgi:outer membrane receptor protein involved in Fe transport
VFSNINGGIEMISGCIESNIRSVSGFSKARQWMAGSSALVFAFAVMSPAAAQVVSAQPSSDKETALASAKDFSDIVVTATRRSTNVQDTPLAISAVSGLALASKGITDSSGLAAVSPGLVLTPGQVTGSRLTLRNIYAAGEPTVGLYYDDTAVIGSSGTTSDAGGTTPDLRLFDIERVEVLRGPQGTLYGASSMGGAVRLIYEKPKLDDVSAAFDGKMFDLAKGGRGFETQAMLNLPVVKDLIGIRATAFYQNRPGYVDNTRLGRSDINDQVGKGGRIMVRFKPTSSVTIDGLVAAQDVNGSLNDYNYNIGPYMADYESLQPVKDRFRLYSGTVNWDMGFATLTAVGAHSYRNFNYSFDISPFFRTLAGLFSAGSAQKAFYNSQAPAVSNSPQITKTDTVETRLVSNSSGPIEWTVGAFYSNRTGNFLNNLLRTDAVSGAVPAVTSATLLGQRSIIDELMQTAGYGEITYKVSDRLSVTGGGRYFHYRRRSATATTVTNPPIGYTVQPLVDLTTSENGWLYKGNVSYKATDKILVYATVSNGERPGGVNQAVGLPASVQKYKSDSVVNYELGVKSDLFDRILLVNIAAFQIDWRDIQTSGQAPNSNFGFIANASRARVRGLETELTLRPMAGLSVQASGSYIIAKLTGDQSNPALLAPGLKGDYLPYVPKVTLQGSVDYSFAVTDAVKATFHADSYYTGVSWNQFRRTNALAQRLPAYVTAGLRAGLGAPDDSWMISVYGTNITNNDAQIQKLPTGALVGAGVVRAISLQPRVVGLEFQKRF